MLKKTLSISLFIVIGLIVTSLGTVYLKSPTTSAASMKNFNASNIIDNAVFYDNNSMSAKQIQKFLNNKMPRCDTKGSGPYGRTGKTVKQYWTPRGEPAPYTCLKDYKQKTPTMSGTESGICGYIKGQKSRTAAQIIKDVGNACGISPKVLLVLLDKEQALVTDNSPLNLQYRDATGMGCPDNAGCDPKYDGFFNQVYGAARQYKLYRANPKNYNYVAGRSNYIQYNPNKSCGGSWIKIKNQATAGLYNYTPYQPNKATRAAPLGGTVHCGAYGNKNFFLYFTNWFGSTHNNYNFSVESLSGSSGAINKVNGAKLGESVETVTDGKKIYTLYRDSSNKTLRIAYWNGSKWSDSLIDGKGAKTSGSVNNDVGQNITAIKWKGQIQAYYYDASSKSLRHAWLKNGAWRTEVMDGAKNSLTGKTDNVGKNAKVIVWRNQLQLYYYNESNGSIRHTWWPGDKRWHFENLDGVKNSTVGGNRTVGTKPIEAVVWRGQIQTYYYDSSSKVLRHTWWPNDGRWHSESFDGTKGSVVGNKSVIPDAGVSAIVWDGQIQTYYHDSKTGELRHTWWPNDGRWHSEVMDGKTKSVLGNEINAGTKVTAKSFGKDIVLFYYDDARAWSQRNSAWRAAYWNNGTWHQTIIDGGDEYNESGSNENIPITSGLGFDKFDKDKVQAFYQGHDGKLKHLWTK